jgi:putative oxidoreductase
MKNFKAFVQPTAQPKSISIALLLLRVVAGAAFVIHGYGKMQSPFSWMPPGAPVPGIFQFLAAFAEFGGGIAFVIGLLTPLAGFGIFCTMSVAVLMHAMVMKDPFVSPTGGHAFELPLAYWTVAVAMMLIGPGKFSLDHKIFGDKKGC